MNYKSLFYILPFLFFFNSNSYCQENNMIWIGFSYNASNWIGEEVEISIDYDEKKRFAVLDIRQYDRHKRFQITIEEYNKICNSLFKISPKDIADRKDRIILDGATTELSFGSGFNSDVTYSILGLGKSDENTSHKDFLNTVRVILEVAKITIPEFN